MIHTDGIQTIANAEPRTAETARRLPPSTRDVRLTDEQWRDVQSAIKTAVGGLPLQRHERSAIEALRAELAGR